MTETTERTLAEERPHPLTPLVQIWVWLVALLVFGVRQVSEDPTSITEFDLTRLSWPFIVFAALGVARLAWTVWEWWTTRFVVTDAELRVDNRGVQHRSRRVAYRRIQAVDINQPFAARLLGMAVLTIDVGGDSPVQLRYLSTARAQQLRSFLMERAAMHKQADPTEAAAVPALDGTAGDGSGADRELIRIPVRELVLGATLSHELLAMLAVGVIGIVLGLTSGQNWLVGTGLIPIALSVLGYFGSRVAGFYRFTLTETSTGLRLRRGLATVSSQMIPVHRIQAVRIEEPLLWRRLGRARISLILVGLRIDEEEGSLATTVLLPIGRRDEVSAALLAIWPGVAVDDIELHPSPAQARWLAPLSWWAMRHGWDDRTLLVRQGWWTRTTWLLPHARLQSSRSRSGPIARRLGLASVEFHVAGVHLGPSAYLAIEQSEEFVIAEMRRAALARAHEARLTSPTPVLSTTADEGAAHR